LKFAYSNKINMLHQDNNGVQKPGGPQIGNSHEAVRVVEEPDARRKRSPTCASRLAGEISLANFTAADGTPHAVGRQRQSWQLGQDIGKGNQRATTEPGRLPVTR